MFKKHRSPVQGQKSKLMAFVAYALAGLLASGSAYAVTDQEFQDLSKKVDNNQSANQTALVMLTQTLAKKEKDFNDQLKNEKDKLKVILEAKEKEARDFMADINAFKSDTTKYLQGVDGKLKDLDDSQGEFETDLADKVSKKEFADGLTEVVKPLKAMGEEIDKKASKQELADGLNAVLKPLEALGKEVDKKASKQELADGLTAVLKPLEALGKEVDKKADKKAVDDQFNEVDKFLRTTEKYLEYVDKEVFEESNPDSLVNRVDANEKAIADKASKKDLADGLTAVAKPLEALGKEVDTNKELIKATAETAEATGELVAALAPKVEANEKAIADNKTAIDKNFAETKENVNKLAEVTLEGIKALDAKKLDKADLANFEADAAKVKKAAAQISNKADRSEVVRLGNAVNADLTAVKNALNTKANQEDLQKVDARVTKVATVVEAQGAAIQSLNNRISGFGSQISDLHNKMEKLEDNVESGLAIQSAHAALFQPYRVGHVNVTAGLGGYKSKTALAVGVGYRFNERVAAKAGVAADTKGKRASYNLGVNFEF